VSHLPSLASLCDATALVSARNPAVLPASASQFSWILEPAAPGGAVEPWEAIELPASLCHAVAKRQVEFRAGRFCAFQALHALDPRRVVTTLPRTSSGAPLWPEGITGSITHTTDFASAAVARTSEVAALGIDTERIIPADRARDVSPAIAWPYELAHARAAGFDRLEALTLVFSAKEAIFKCLHDSVGFFDFHDVRIVGVDARARTFTARIVRTLSERFPANTVLEGRFEIDVPWIHTGIALAAEG